MEVHRKRLAKFHDAIFNSDLPTVDRLLAKGVSVNATYRGETAFTLATACIVVDQRHGYEDLERQRARELIAEAIFADPHIDPKASSKKKRTALHAAASMGREDWVGKLVYLGAKVNKKDVEGETPLALAIHEDKASCLRRMLVTSGVDGNQRNKQGLPLLHLACQRFSAEAVSVLLQHGCDVNARGPHGENALMVAADAWERLELKLFPKWLEITELLIQAGCDVNGRDYSEKTLLERIIKTKNVYGTCLLLERGCDANLLDSRGFTPAQSAIHQNRNEIAKFLLCYGSRWEVDSFQAERLWRQNPYLSSAVIESALQSFYNMRTPGDLRITEDLIYGLLGSTHSASHFMGFEAQVEALGRIIIDPPCETSQVRLANIERNIKECMAEMFKGPFSLQYLTKLKIRDTLGAHSILSKIERLPIPLSLRRFLNLGVALDKCRLDKTVHLQAAVVGNNREKLRSALEAGADARVALGGLCALELALHFGSDDVVSELFHFLCLSQSGFPTTTGFNHGRLIGAAASPYLRPTSSRGLTLGPRQTSEHLHFSETEDTALHLVARTGRSCHVEAALKLSPDHIYMRNASGKTCVEEALNKGLHSNIVTAEAIILHGAAEISSPGTRSVVKYLTLADMGVTLIHVACAAGALSLVDKLLTGGCFTANCVDSFGYTPLDLAENQGQQYRMFDKTQGQTGLNIQDIVLFISNTHNQTGQFQQVVRVLLDYGATAMSKN